MKKNIPVIFFHLGEQDYFHSALYLAAKKNEVIVIGNQSTAFAKQHPDVVFVDHIEYRDGTDDFSKTYQHMHMSGAEMQLICYVRWIIVQNLCKKRNIERFFYADSDLAILSNLTDVFYEHINSDFALMTQSHQPTHRLVASAHSSYWHINTLNAFCKFMFDSYNNLEIKSKLVEKFKWHQETNRPGGVCDMTQLYLFSQQTAHVSLTKSNNKSCFDDNVNAAENYEPEEYHVEHEMKKILVNKDQFYFLSNKEGPILAHVIHCQGGAKNLLNAICKHVKGLK
jgi:hypothetical protein